MCSAVKYNAQMNMDTIVTIDGPTGAGKSSVGKLLAERIGYTYLDTGAMYRVVALETKRSGIDPEAETALADLCSRIDISFKRESGMRVYSSGRDVTDEIRTPEISMLASRVSAKACVREALVRMQRACGRQGKIVADGRDAGTVIFPAARYKFFLDAAPDVRSQRRYKELIDKNLKVDYSDVYRDLLQRDQDDSSRAIAPLKPAADAVIINTTRMTIEDVVQELAQAIDAQRLQCHK
jgi:cytidylate kinase